MAFLDTKRHNISKNMFATNKVYKHPYINGKGELAWKTYQGGYKDFLLNSKNPILITNAVNSNSKYNGNKMLFASKNVILDSSNNGKPKILNKLQAEPVQTPKAATKPAAAPGAKPVATPVKAKVESINTDISIVSVTHDETINILSIKVKNNQSNNLTDFSIDTDSGEIKIYRFNLTTQAYETLNLGEAKPLAVLAGVIGVELANKVLEYQENDNKDLKSFLNLFGIAETAESAKEVSSNQEVDKDKTVDQVAKEITECTGVVPSSTVMNGEELTELPVTSKPSATPEGNPNKFNGQEGRNKKK